MNDLVLETAAAIILQAVTKNKRKSRVRAVCLRVYRAIKLAYAGDRDFE